MSLYIEYECHACGDVYDYEGDPDADETETITDMCDSCRDERDQDEEDRQQRAVDDAEAARERAYHTRNKCSGCGAFYAEGHDDYRDFCLDCAAEIAAHKLAKGAVQVFGNTTTGNTNTATIHIYSSATNHPSSPEKEGTMQIYSYRYIRRMPVKDAPPLEEGEKHPPAEVFRGLVICDQGETAAQRMVGAECAKRPEYREGIGHVMVLAVGTKFGLAGEDD